MKIQAELDLDRYQHVYAERVLMTMSMKRFSRLSLVVRMLPTPRIQPSGLNRVRVKRMTPLRARTRLFVKVQQSFVVQNCELLVYKRRGRTQHMGERERD